MLKNINTKTKSKYTRVSRLVSSRDWSHEQISSLKSWQLLYRSFSLIWVTNRFLFLRSHDKSTALNADDVVLLRQRLALFKRLLRNSFISRRFSFVLDSVRRSISRTKDQNQQQEERLLHDDEISRYRIRHRFNEDSSIYWEARENSKSCDDLSRKTSHFALKFEVSYEISILHRKSSYCAE